MKQIFLGLALHNHQPVGNFPWVFEQAYQNAYLPMLEALELHPTIRLSLHYSGPLLDWLRANRPGFLPRVRQLVNRKQVEIMSGGYYEPILPAIPDADKQGQIEKMSQVVQNELGYPPSGLWLAERVWEPHLPQVLAHAGIKWTVVDDTHFKMVGLRDEDLLGYYITEEQGNAVSVFSTSKPLRYLIPWHEVEEAISFLRDQATQDGTRIAVMGDDGEKFGSWPGTYQRCWQEKWIETFFDALQENRHWLKTIPLGEYVDSFPALGRIYLPCASYDEMLEWALPSDKSSELTRIRQELVAQKRQDVVQYLHGGFWRHFLVKYPEINTMHKKMLRVHRKVYRARQVSQADCGLDDLWQGQCNCPYWHGVFGGIYLTDIRAATYHHLIQAENKADAVLRGNSWLDCETVDFDYDGHQELLAEGDATSLYIDPTHGGSIIEWDLRSHSYNLASTVARRPEAYHQALQQEQQSQENGKMKTIHDGIRVKEKGLHQYLHYDRYPRACMLDHFLPANVTLSCFIRSAYQDLGDFIEQPYKYEVKRTSSEIKISLQRHGCLKYDRRLLPFQVEKDLVLRPGQDKLAITYTLTNLANVPVTSIFGTEWNINLLGGGHNDQAYYEIAGVQLEDWHLDSTGELAEVQQIALGNRYLGIKLMLNTNPKMGLWRFPVETICNSEGGLERVYQGSCLVLLLPFNLAPGESLNLELAWFTER